MRIFGEVDFEEINFAWLQRFERLMTEEGLKINARCIHFRNIRAILNQAINEELVSLNNYPFRKFRIKKEATMKRAISADNLRLLFSYSGDVYENRARDVAISNIIFVA